MYSLSAVIRSRANLTRAEGGTSNDRHIWHVWLSNVWSAQIQEPSTLVKLLAGSTASGGTASGATASSAARTVVINDRHKPPSRSGASFRAARVNQALRARSRATGEPKECFISVCMHG